MNFWFANLSTLHAVSVIAYVIFLYTGLKFFFMITSFSLRIVFFNLTMMEIFFIAISQILYVSEILSIYINFLDMPKQV